MLHALDLEVENEDPLSENMANVGTMNHASEAVGDWITPTICPCTRANCFNNIGKFSSMNWQIVAKDNKVELKREIFD